MRKLNWSKVPDIKVKGTIWESEATDDSEASRLDGGELEGLFGTKPKDKDAAGAEGAPSARERKGSTAVSQVALVDSKRAQQISTILGNLRSMHLSQEVVLGALLEADLGRLDNPRMPVEMVLSILVSSMPQPDEIEAIEGYVLEGPREALRDVETWLLLVKEGLPSYLKRTTALQARASFHEAHGEALGLSSRVLSTARQIRGSATLQRLLSMTLAIGNYLNGTSRTGGAYGFKLNVLADLASTKTVDGKSTLLHYLASKTATLGKGGGPLVADLRGELAELDDPVRFEWSVLSAEIAALSKGVTSIKQLVRPQPASPPPPIAPARRVRGAPPALARARRHRARRHRARRTAHAGTAHALPHAGTARRRSRATRTRSLWRRWAASTRALRRRCLSSTASPARPPPSASTWASGLPSRRSTRSPRSSLRSLAPSSARSSR